MHSSFNRSPLVRLLAQWAPAEAAGAGMDVAERLSLWVSAFDAMGLQAAHQSIRSLRTAAPGRPVHPRARLLQALQDDARRVRAALVNAIAQDPLPLARLPAGSGKRAADPLAAAWAPYHQRHLELQRQMEQMIGALRDHVRQALGTASPRLRRLAALDAVLEPVIARREQALLPTAAALAERRFRALWAAGDPAPAPDAAAAASKERFEHEWRAALHAELDLRLQPVLGMIDAVSASGAPLELTTESR